VNTIKYFDPCNDLTFTGHPRSKFMSSSGTYVQLSLCLGNLFMCCQAIKQSSHTLLMVRYVVSLSLCLM
jgi:hypothetical protein